MRLRPRERREHPAAGICALALALLPPPAAAQQSPLLVEGIDHYWNARYESALETLSEEAVAALPPEQQPEALQYRGFSQVALGRDAEAEASFTRLLELAPGIELDGSLVSPKILARFGAARGAAAARRLEEGRTRYDAGEYAAALLSFESLLALEPGHALAGEYRQLCRARLELAEVAASAATPKPTPAPSGGTDPDAAGPEADRVYTLNAEIVAPTLVKRVDPDYPRLDRERGHGGTVVLLIVVDRQGEVEVERVLRPVNPRLDAAASRAVRSWRYRPALLDLTPVAVYKVVRLQFVP